MKRNYFAAVAAVITCSSVAPLAQAACPTDRCSNTCLQQHTCVQFAGDCWTIKDSNASEVGPGPNVFSKDNVWVADDGPGGQCRLHLQIAEEPDGTWSCAELINQKPLAYGTYRVTYDTPVDDLDDNAVLALFTWNDKPSQAHTEIDIEFSHWGDPSNPNDAQYVVQPYTNPSRIRRWPWPAGFAGFAPSNHSFLWRPGAVQFASYAGLDQRPANLLQSWTFSGSKVPAPKGGNARMNLWLFRGAPPADGQRVEVIVSGYSFVPYAP